MANPQKENGSTDIANELLEIIYSSKFNGTELAIILCILRYTYGFHRKEHQLSISFIAEAIKRHKLEVSKYINKLIKNNILIEYEKPSFSSSRQVGINKNYSQWNTIQLVKLLTPSKNTNTTVSKITNTTVSKITNQETKKETKKETKNIYGGYKRIKLYKKEYEKLCQDFGKDFIDEQIKLLDEYVESNNNKNKYTNFNLVLRKSIREGWFKSKGGSTQGFKSDLERQREILEEFKNEHRRSN